MGLAISPLANHAATDDAPIVLADLMLFALAALSMMACVAVFVGLVLGAALRWLWHHWRPAHREQPESLRRGPAGGDFRPLSR